MRKNHQNTYDIDPANPRLKNIDLFKWILSVNSLTSTEKLTMMGIFAHRNVYSFLCYPSIQTVALETSLSRKTVRNCIAMLDQTRVLIRSPETIGNRTLRTYYFATWDINQAFEVTEYPEANFWKFGTDDIFLDVWDKWIKESPF